MLRGVKGLVRGLDRLLALRLPPTQGGATRLKNPNLFGILNFSNGGSGFRSASRLFSTAKHVPQLTARVPSIQSSLTFTTRATLGRPLYAPFLPKVTPIPRSITQVGLGTARNFSSTRHVFQNIADNVPIATRAFWEADWELKYRKENPARSSRLGKKEKKRSSKRVADKAKPRSTPLAQISPVAAITSASEISYSDPATALSYFFSSSVPLDEDVTTILTVPLAPQQSPRRPLADDARHPLLPVPSLLDTHEQFSTHAIRISSLFSRLDTADVWSQGVECEVLGTSSNSEQSPRQLVVRFNGWTRDRVRGVLGDAGETWCHFEEVVVPSRHAAIRGDVATIHQVEEAAYPARNQQIEFVMPSIDFSSTFLDRWESMPIVGEPEDIGAVWEQAISDIGTIDDEWHHWSDHDDSAWSSGVEGYT